MWYPVHLFHHSFTEVQWLMSMGCLRDVVGGGPIVFLKLLIFSLMQKTRNRTAGGNPIWSVYLSLQRNLIGKSSTVLTTGTKALYEGSIILLHWTTSEQDGKGSWVKLQIFKYSINRSQILLTSCHLIIIVDSRAAGDKFVIFFLTPCSLPSCSVFS